MNKKLIMISQASVMVLVNQGFAMSYTVNVEDVMTKKEKDGKVILSMDASKLKEKVSEGGTFKLTVPGKIDGKQVELAPRAFCNLDIMEDVSLQLTFENGVKFPSDCFKMFAFDASNKKSPITSIDFGEVDTSNVTNMEGMFYMCGSLNSLDVSNFNTKNVKDMHYMFNGCETLKSLNVRNFNTQNVTNMHSMFWGCNNLDSLDLSSFNTQNVTDMNSMFCSCKALKSLDLSNFNTQNVTNMHSMFWGCNNLDSLDLSSFNTQNVTDMNSMFWGCKALNSLNLSNFDTQKVTDMNYMFFGCNNLKSLVVNKNYFSKNILNKLAERKVEIIYSSENKQNKENKEENLENALHAKRNELNQIYWRIVANNAIVNADPKGKHAWIKDKKEYGESIMKVIGKAIGDCVTGENEFANPTKDGLIVFKASPEEYKPEHWNAVMLYNYIKAKRDEVYKKYIGYLRPTYVSFNFEELQTKLYEHYNKDYNGDERDLFRLIDQARKDIKQYNEALWLDKTLEEFFSIAKEYDDRKKEEGELREILTVMVKKVLHIKHMYNIYDWITRRSVKVSEYENTDLVKKKLNDAHKKKEDINQVLDKQLDVLIDLILVKFKENFKGSDKLKKTLKQRRDEECKSLSIAYNTLGKILKDEVIQTLVGIDKANSRNTKAFDDAQNYWENQPYKDDNRVPGLLTKEIPQDLPDNNTRLDKQKENELLYSVKLKVYNKEYDIKLKLFNNKLDIKSLTSRTKKNFSKKISDAQNNMIYEIPQCFEVEELVSKSSKEYEYVQDLFRGLLS